MAVDGRLTLPTGISYSLLVIQRNNDMPCMCCVI